MNSAKQTAFYENLVVAENKYICLSLSVYACFCISLLISLSSAQHSHGDKMLHLNSTE